MANFVFNVAKGAVAEYARRVNAGDPANAVLGILALAATGIESDATLMDSDTVTELLSGSTAEANNTGYSRIELDGTDGITVTVDHAADRVDVDIPDQVFSGVETGGAWAALVIYYRPDSTVGDDDDNIPLTKHDFAVTPETGVDIIAQIAAAGFFRAA